MTKQARQAAIREILKAGTARSQQEILDALRARGVEASPITVSRDLRELGVAKLAGGAGRAYAIGAAPAPDPARLARTLRELVVSVEAAGQFVVLKTPPSGAQPVGLALDQAALSDVAGTIAGDDTVFVLARSDAGARRLAASLERQRNGA